MIIRAFKVQLDVNNSKKPCYYNILVALDGHRFNKKIESLYLKGMTLDFCKFKRTVI